MWPPVSLLRKWPLGVDHIQCIDFINDGSTSSTAKKERNREGEREGRKEGGRKEERKEGKDTRN